MAKECGEVLGLFFANKMPHFWGDYGREMTKEDLLVTWAVKNSHNLKNPSGRHLSQGDTLSCHSVCAFPGVLEEMADVSTQIT